MVEFRALPWVPQDALGPSTVRGYLMDRTPGRNLISQAVAEVGGELACVCGPLPTVALRPRIPNIRPGSILVGRNRKEWSAVFHLSSPTLFWIHFFEDWDKEEG